MRKNKNGIFKSFKNLAKYLKPYSGWLILALVLSVAGAVSMVIGPKLLGDITKYSQDFVITGNKHIADITNTAFILIAVYACAGVCDYFCGFIMTGVSQKVSNKMRKDISKKINDLPLSYFDSRSFGDVLSRVTNDVDLISQNMNQALTQIVSSITLFVGVFVMMLYLSGWMTLIALVSIPVSFILMMIIVKFSQKFFRNQQIALGTINGHIEEAYSGHTVIKAFNHEEESYNEFDKLNQSLKSSAWKSQFLSGMMMPIISFVGNLSYISICVFGGLLIIGGVFGLEYIQMFIQYTRLLNQPVQQIGQITTVLQSCAAASDRVFEFLEEKELPKENPTKVLLKEDVIGDVDFENINFGYTKEKQIIFDFNCHVKKGSKIAIVGPTGAGKTTLVNLLMRFYEPTSGDIKIDGINTKDISRENVASLFGMVLQDTWLFSGTIRDNLKFGNPNISDENIYRALEACHMDHFVRSLPGGLDFVLDENANVSSGQKQLLTIARTMIEGSPMLILDEATSSVDTRTEAMIQKAMDNLMKNRTSFVIAHRLSTIKNADLILVLKDGNIVEQGSHDELIKKQGFYEKLYNSQFEE